MRECFLFLHMYNRLWCEVGPPHSQWQTFRLAREKLGSGGPFTTGDKNTSLKINLVNLIRAVTCSASLLIVSKLHTFDTGGQCVRAEDPGVMGCSWSVQPHNTTAHSLRHQSHLPVTKTWCTESQPLFGPLKAKDTFYNPEIQFYISGVNIEY